MDSKDKNDSVYTALVSPDAYDYLDSTCPDDFVSDPLLEEQEALEDFDLFEEDEAEPVTEPDSDEDAYSGNLFDLTEDYEEDPVCNTKQEDNTEPLMFGEDEEDNLIVNEKVVEKPKQEVKKITSEILQKISSYCSDRYNDIIQYITKSPNEDLEDLASTIEKARDSFLEDGKDKMFSIPDTEITVAVVENRDDPLLDTQRLEYIATEMLLKGRGFWNILFLTFRKDGEVRNAEFVSISKSSFSEGEWRIIQGLAQRIKERSR